MVLWGKAMSGRRRCIECRRYFVPLPMARHNQKTCCEECRVHRKRKLAKRRRANDLEGFRADERERQKEHRARQKGCAKKTGKQPPMSRATLSPREAILRAEIVKNWDKAIDLSRAGFQRQISLLLGREAKIIGQAGTENVCHALSSLAKNTLP
jgi:hypothetical protein